MKSTSRLCLRQLEVLSRTSDSFSEWSLIICTSNCKWLLPSYNTCVKVKYYIMNIYTLYVSVAIQRIYVEVTMDIIVPDRN